MCRFSCVALPIFAVLFRSFCHGEDTAVEIGAHSFQVHPSQKRLIRRDNEAASTDAVGLVEEGSDRMAAEIPADSVIDRTIPHLMHYKSSMLESAAMLVGPGNLASAGDAWGASVRAMNNLSHSPNFEFNCQENYGARMLENMVDIKNAHHICTGTSSTITCHERTPFDCPRYMCELKNVLISAEGTTVTGCIKSGDFDSFTKKQGITENNIFGKGTKYGALNMSKGELQCASTSSRPALVQVPANTQNFYEWYGDWVTLWETLASLKLDPKDVDLYLVGNISGANTPFARPFDEAWSRAFKAENLHVGSYSKLFNNGICFPRIVTVPQGELSTISFNGGRGGVVGCASPTVIGSALFLQALFHNSTMRAAVKPTKTVTLLLRKGMRRFESDDVAISAVKSVLPSDWSLNLYRPEETSTLTEQLAVAGSTQVWVGVHGAGMMHVLFLPPKARVVEIFCQDRSRDNHHYRNLEILGEPAVGPHLFQYYYDSAEQSCSVDTKQVKDAITAYDKNPASSTDFSVKTLSSEY